MKRRILFPVMVLMLALLLPAVGLTETRYVKTESGNSVNLRLEPNTASQVVAQLHYGQKVNEIRREGSWSYVDIGIYDPAWVKTKFLTSAYPGTHPKKEAKKETSKETKKDTGLNFSSFHVVEPYYVYVQASHSGGFVNLRWAPSMEMMVAQRVNDGAELLVIAEGNGWCQVQDERSGLVGFMKTGFLVKAPVNTESNADEG